MSYPNPFLPRRADSSRFILAASAATLLAALFPIPSTHAQIALTGSTTYTQNFDSLGIATAAWADNTTIPGWFAGISTAANAIPDGNLTISDGSTTALTGLLNLGTTNAADRALGSKVTGTGNFANIAYGVAFQNNAGRTMSVVNIRYTGELWLSNSTTTAATPELWTTFTKISAAAITDPEPGAAGAVAEVGTFTAAPAALNWTSPTTAAAVVLDGNAAANRVTVSGNPNLLLPASQFFMFKWTDTNLAGTDGHQGIDDFSITFANAAVYNLAHTVGGAANGVLEVSANQYWLDGAAGSTTKVGFDNGDAITFSQAGTATIAVPADVAPAQTTVSAASGAYTLGGAGKISGPLVKTGAGTLILGTANSFTSTAISAGIVEVQTLGALGTGPITFANGAGTLRIRNNGTGDNGTLAFGNNVTVAINSTLDLDRAAGGTAVGNTVAFGTLSIGTQILTVAGANGYKTRFDGATTLTGNATISTNAEVILQGSISGSFAIAKTGLGQLTLNSNANNYTGSTTVSAGSIGGTGTVGAALVVNNGATLAPGNGPGIFASNTSLTLAAGSTFSIDLAHNGGGTPVAGTDYDQMKVGTGTGTTSTGAVTLGGGNLTLNLGTGIVPDDIFFIILNDGNDTVSGTFSGLAQGASLPSGLFRISYTANATTNSETGGNDVALIALAVPEPGIALLALFGAAPLICRRRRR